MALLHIVVLALVQGLTEFLPISSSAHLILVPTITGWPDQGIEIDIAVHVGSLGAVIAYFHRDIVALASGARGLVGGPWTVQTRLLLLFALSTLPIIAAGALFAALDIVDALRSAEVIGWATLLFGILLYVVDRFSPSGRTMEEITVASALLIGIAQILALIPGTSRSGITMTMARLLGMTRSQAARFSLLLSLPTILAAGGYASLKLARADEAALGVDAVIAAILAFISAFVAIALLMRWLQHASFTPFVIYRVVLGLALLGWVYTS